MGKTQVSSQCFWDAHIKDVSTLISSVRLVKKATILSSGSFDLPKVGRSRRVSTTLKDLINTRNLYAISIPKNSTHDTFVLLPDYLHLSLTPESFAKFGLDGVKTNSRYTTVIPLQKGKSKRMDRLNWAVDNTILDLYDVVVIDPEDRVNASRETKVLDIAVPPLEPPNIENEEELTDQANAILEWIGLAMLTPQLLAKNNGHIDPAICDYHHPENSRTMPVSVSQILDTGLVYSDVLEIWKNLANQDWAVLHVQGYSFNKESGYTLITSKDHGTHCFKFM